MGYIRVEIAFFLYKVLSLMAGVRNQEFHSSFTVTPATFIDQFLGSIFASLSIRDEAVGRKLNSVCTDWKRESEAIIVATSSTECCERTTNWSRSPTGHLERWLQYRWPEQRVLIVLVKRAHGVPLQDI